MKSMIEVASMKHWHSERAEYIALPTKRDTRLGRNIFDIIEGTREWVPVHRVDIEGRLIDA